MAEDLDTSRSAVKTYVPAYQKEEWVAHADELDMSQSEFVRAMVQAGRKSFDPVRFEGDEATETVEGNDTRGETGDESTTVTSLDEQVVEALEATDHLSWDGLLAELTDDIEERLEASLDRLQRRNRVGYRGRYGGYTLLEDDGE